MVSDNRNIQNGAIEGTATSSTRNGFSRAQSKCVAELLFSSGTVLESILLSLDRARFGRGITRRVSRRTTGL